VLFTGDLTHDSEKPGEHADRMRAFREIAGRLRAPLVKFVPGEHDAGLDGGKLFRDALGDSHYSFDHRGVHFIALDNVSLARPNVGPDQLGWLAKDLARFPHTAPIVVFTHRPLFDLRPDWSGSPATGTR
jgi:3',5'-cyclic AMP phosphodiesterase CpdA